MNYLEISLVYNGSNGDATRALYAKLEKVGPLGVVALNLFRALKTSSRAKLYRGRGYKDAAYDTKTWSLDNLVRVLIAQDDLGIGFGWGRDEKAVGFENVLYVEIPTGQMSFHTERRGDGPDYQRSMGRGREDRTRPDMPMVRDAADLRRCSSNRGKMR